MSSRVGQSHFRSLFGWSSFNFSILSSRTKMASNGVNVTKEFPRVLSIQSHVVHGYVGNKSATFPLQVLGFEVDAINTVQFTTHTHYKHVRGQIISNDDLSQLVEGLTLNDVDDYTHLLTGYSRDPQSLHQVASILDKLKKKNPDLIYVCDPVMGDNGKMYVPEEILPIYKDVIIPLADIITPNQFEAELLTGMKITDLDSLLKVTKKLHERGIKIVVVSSTELGDEENMISLASLSDGTHFIINIPKVEAQFTGTGDLFASLMLAWSYKTKNNIKMALEKTISTMQAIIKDTYHHAIEKAKGGKLTPALMELRLIQNKSAIENPAINIEAKAE